MERGFTPESRIGVFKRLSDVPTMYRLEQSAREFEGRDVWAEFVAADDRRQYMRTERMHIVERVEGEWKDHMADRGRHHALATPEDVEAWAESSLQRRSEKVTYTPYWSYIEGFFSWLQERTDYPHLYHPVLMAAVDYPNARTVWDYKMSYRETTESDR